MGKLIFLIFALLFFISTSSAGELQGKEPDENNSSSDRNKVADCSPQDGSWRKGYSVFPIEAPVRGGSEKGKRGNLSEDKEFMNSLRMFFGLDGSGTPECFKQPIDRGSLRDE